MPFTIPLVPTLATPVAELLHVPPVLVVARVLLLPMHIAVLPVMLPGPAFTVTTVVLEQPETV